MRSKGVTGALYLMRHGRTALDVSHRSDGWLDTPLSAEGQLSIIPAQQCLKTVPLKTIYAPDLKRTTETAQLVASGTVSKPEVKKANKAKTWNLGVLAGTRKRYGRPAVQRLIDDPDTAPLGGESFNTFKDRFLPWFSGIARQASHTSKPILIVCSGSNLRCIGAQLFGDQDALDLDEGGLAVLWRAAGKWHDEVLLGGKGTEGRVAGKDSDLADGGKAAMDKALGAKGS